MKTERIQLLDALRGFCIILVAAYHCGYALVLRGILPAGAISNLALNILQPFFAGVFIVLAGISSRLSRSNLRRGLLLLGCAALVTGVSILAGSPIYIGILHLLASCILLYTLLEKLRITAPAVLLGAFFVLYFDIMAWPDIKSADYFPIVPWGFLFFFGTNLGGSIKDGKFPKWFYEANPPVFPTIGRKTLLIYLLHVPVIYGILWIVDIFFG